MFGAQYTSAPFQLSDFEILVVVVVVESLVIAHWLCRHVRVGELVMRAPWWATALCLALMLFAITLCSGESESYLYFRY